MYSQKEREITKSDLDQVERYADKLFGALKIDVEFTKHFMDRVNDARNVNRSPHLNLFDYSNSPTKNTVRRLQKCQMMQMLSFMI